MLKFYALSLFYILKINTILFFFKLSYRYSGELSDFGVKLDEFATLLWENVSYCLTDYKQYFLLIMMIINNNNNKNKHLYLF